MKIVIQDEDYLTIKTLKSIISLAESFSELDEDDGIILFSIEGESGDNVVMKIAHIEELHSVVENG